MTLDRSLLESLVETALAAGRVVMDVYGGDFAVATKGDASPVTEADERAEAVILADLARLLPGVPVVAEEEAAAGRLPAALGDRFVLVDPLDGTKEFVSRNGEFTVNIAVVEAGRPIAGVVVAPALGEIFVGAIDGGARAGRVEADGRIVWRDVAVRPQPAEGSVVLASRSHAGPETEALLARLPVARRVSAGSSLKFCRVAAGEADLYPRLGRTMEWDTAAGDAVLRAAGGAVVGLDGRPLAYGKRNQTSDADFANPWFLAGGSAATLTAAVAAAADLAVPSPGA
jgi:3'(2'),5'-bisphosphate nucleotidase